MCLAVPGKVISIATENGLRIGKIDYEGAIGKACLDYVPEVAIGQYVIVHAGFALNVLDEEEAKASLEVIEEFRKETAESDN